MRMSPTACLVAALAAAPGPCAAGDPAWFDAAVAQAKQRWQDSPYRATWAA